MANWWRLVDEKTTNRQIAGMVLFDIKPNLGRKCQKMTGLRRSSSFNVNGDFFEGWAWLDRLGGMPRPFNEQFFRHCQDQKVGDRIDHRPGQLHCVQEVFAFPPLSNPSENQQKLDYHQRHRFV